MMKYGIFVIIFSVMIGTVATRCEVENCDNYDLLPLDHFLGLIGKEEVYPLCRIINQLETCAYTKFQDCQDEVKSALMSTKVICQNTDVYSKAVEQCYFNADVEDIVDICQEDMTEMDCMSISTFQNCITTDESMKDHCSSADIALLDDITTARLHPYRQKYNCLVTTRETTLPSTLMTSSAMSLSSSTSAAASSTTESTNNPIGSGPYSGGIKAGAASLENNIVLSVMTMSSAIIAMYIEF